LHARAAVQVRSRPTHASMALAMAVTPTAATKPALRLLAKATGCGDSKAAIVADAAKVAAAVMGRMTGMGPAGRETTVVALWLSCCAGGGIGGCWRPWLPRWRRWGSCWW